LKIYVQVSTRIRTIIVLDVHDILNPRLEIVKKKFIRLFDSPTVFNGKTNRSVGYYYAYKYIIVMSRKSLYKNTTSTQLLNSSKERERERERQREVCLLCHG